MSGSEPTVLDTRTAGDTAGADAHALDAVLAHHALLRARMTAHTAEVLQAATATTSPAEVDPRCAAARGSLVAFALEELMPHAQAEEGTLYAAAAQRTTTQLLVQAMQAEHVLLRSLVDDVAAATSAVGIAAAAHALSTLFGAHVDKENLFLLPALAATPGVSIADLLAGMHELIGGDETQHTDHTDHTAHTEHTETGAALAVGETSQSCTCGSHDDGVPELDVRTIPHAIRHATVFGAFDSLRGGASLDLVAPHDPVPLLNQLRTRAGSGLDVAYLDRGPHAWRVRLTRK